MVLAFFACFITSCSHGCLSKFLQDGVTFEGLNGCLESFQVSFKLLEILQIRSKINKGSDLIS